MTRLILSILLMLLVTGCATAKVKDYEKFNAAKPRSILIVPVVNRSVEVTAPDYFLSTITIPLAEKGYYVFPVNLVKRMLEDDGLSDSGLVHNASVEKLSNLFGADAVLYVTINQWDAQYLVLSTQVNVDLTYVIKDGKTGDTLWEHNQKMVYSPQQNSGGHPLAQLISAVVNAAIAKAAPNYVPLASQANNQAFTYPGPGIPPGPYAQQ
ncbi:MAG: GNA1162 family protein [Desulfuromonadales bacterium]